MQYLTIWDLLLTPLYLLVLSLIARRQRDKRYPVGHPLRPFFLKGLYLKFAGAIFIGLLYQYYYGGGDTFNFLRHSQIINSALDRSLSTWFKLITHLPVDSNPDIYDHVVQMYWYDDKASYSVAAIGAVFGLFNGTSYMPISLLFAYFSYTGIWALYRTFTNIYPRLYKPLAYACLFIPSTIVWGSALFKDTVCMFGLGWMTYTVFRLFINRDFSVRNILLLLLSFYLVYLIKIYILLAFLPALIIWLLTTYSGKIPYAGLRMIVKVGFVAFAAVVFLYFTKIFAAELDQYSLENIAQTAATTRGWISYVSGDQGSAYNLGDFDPSVGGMLQKFPQAVVVTLFRPFPWEARKVIAGFSALEALAFVYFTFQAFRKRGTLKTLQLIGHDPNLLFAIVFSLIFAFAVGISSYNFGSLSRYKIPCLPFFGAFLMIILHYDKHAASVKIPPAWAPQLKRRRKLAS